MVTGVNSTHKHQRNHFHDEEDKEDYEDIPSNLTETTLLNAIQDLPRNLQETNTKLLQTLLPSLNILYITSFDQSQIKSTNDYNQRNQHIAKRLSIIQKGICKGRHARGRPIQIERSQIRPDHSDICRFSERSQEDC